MPYPATYWIVNKASEEEAAGREGPGRDAAAAGGGAHEILRRGAAPPSPRGGPEAIRLRDIARDLNLAPDDPAPLRAARASCRRSDAPPWGPSTRTSCARSPTDRGIVARGGARPRVQRRSASPGTRAAARLVRALGDFTPRRPRGPAGGGVARSPTPCTGGSRRRAQLDRTPPREEADFTVRHRGGDVGDALVGDGVEPGAGAPRGRRCRFRAWLARLPDERFRQVTGPKKRSGREG